MVFTRTNPFRTDLPQYQQRVIVSLERSIDDSRGIIAAAVQGLRRLWCKGFAYHKAGLMLLDLSHKANRQLPLTETPQTGEEAKRASDGDDGQAQSRIWERGGSAGLVL